MLFCNFTESGSDNCKRAITEQVCAIGKTVTGISYVQEEIVCIVSQPQAFILTLK